MCITFLPVVADIPCAKLWIWKNILEGESTCLIFTNSQLFIVCYIWNRLWLYICILYSTTSNVYYDKFLLNIIHFVIEKSPPWKKHYNFFFWILDRIFREIKIKTELRRGYSACKLHSALWKHIRMIIYMHFLYQNSKITKISDRNNWV